MGTYTLVIAKYNESVDWVNKMNKDNVIIYNKGTSCNQSVISKKNIGREVESFMYHIVNNYYTLPDYLVFVQGHPFDHFDTEYIDEDNFQSKLDALIESKPTDVQHLFRKIYVEDHYHYPSMKTPEYYSLFFDSPVPPKSIFASGCQYIVPKENILSRPIQFYMKVHAMTLNTTVLTERESSFGNVPFDIMSINGWCLERLLLQLFSKNIPSSPFMCKKRYLITGGAGFIGSRLVNILSKENSIVVIDNLCTGNINYIHMNSNIQYIQGDILNNDIFTRVGYIDGIFHFAAMSKVLPSLDNKDMMNFCVEQNVLGTINVFKYASSFNRAIKVIYSASSTYYGLNDIPNVETQPQDCQTPYALSKFCGELFCELFYRMYKVPNVRLKYFMVYGPNEPSNGSYAIVTGIFLKRKREGLPLIIHGDGMQTRDFVHVDDICKANILAMNNAELVNDTINVGTGEMISIKELADLISPNQEFIEKRQVDLQHTLCDTTRLNEKLGWVPENKIRQYILSSLS